MAYQTVNQVAKTIATKKAIPAKPTTTQPTQQVVSKQVQPVPKQPVVTPTMNVKGQEELNRVINGSLGVKSIDKIANAYGIDPQQARTYVQLGAKTNLAKATGKDAERLRRFYGDLVTPAPIPSLQATGAPVAANAPSIAVPSATPSVAQTLAEQNRAKAAAIQAQKQGVATPTPTTAPTTPVTPEPTPTTALASRQPTAQQLADWALKGGKTNLQDNAYWSRQPMEVRQAAWDIIQGKQAGQQPQQPIPTETVDTSGTDNIFPSEQQTQVNTYQDLLNLPQDRWDTYLDSTVSSYQKLAEDLTNMMATQQATVQADYKAMIESLNKRADLMTTESKTAIAQAKTDAKGLLDIATQQKANALKANELAAKEADNQYGLQVDLMRDNNSRYFGYMKGKLEAAGMLDSTAGMELLNKQMVTNDLALASVVGSRVNTQQEFLQTSRDIGTSYFEQAFKVESEKNKQINTINSTMFEQLQAIEESKITSTAKKNEQLMDITKAAFDKQMEIKEKTTQAIKDITSAKIEEAKYKFDILKAIDDQERYWTEFEEMKRQSGVSEQQWNAEYALEKAKYDAEQAAAGEFDFLKILGDISGLGVTDEMKNQLLEMYAPGLISSAYEYTDPVTGKPMNLEERIVNTLDKITSGSSQEDLLSMFTIDSFTKENPKLIYEKLGANYQCVQFVRDVIPDLPYGLQSLEDKKNLLVNSPNGKPKGSVPETGDVVVLNWSAKGSDSGHVALISAVNLEKGQIEISQFNKPANQFSKEWINIGDQGIEGYWRSPNLKKVSSDVFQAKGKAMTSLQKANLELNLKKGLQNSPSVKYYKIMRSQMNTVDQAYSAYLENPNDAAAAELIQVGFEQFMSPNSVVMPSEAERTARMQTVYQKAQGLLSQYAGVAASKLSPETINNMYEMMQEVKASFDEQITTEFSTVYSSVDENELNINSVVDSDLQKLYNLYSSDSSTMSQQEENIYESW